MGSWAFCDEQGDYNEIHITKQRIFHSAEYNLFDYNYLYILEGDSLIVFIDGIIKSSRIEFINENHVLQHIQGREKPIEWEKITYNSGFPDFITNDSLDFLEKKKFYVLLFSRRKKLLNCKTDRTNHYSFPKINIEDIDTNFIKED